MTTTFKFGDRVRHPARPEWGEAVVTASQGVTHEGKPCQRLTLRFDRAGIKTLLTAVVALELAGPDDGAAPVNVQTNGQAAGKPNLRADGHALGSWLAEAAALPPEQLFARLPDATRDRFDTLEDRLKATLLLYRFSDRGAALLDWAAMQTGLADPLSKFSRHELEQYFLRFADQRAEHLRTLLAEAAKKDPGLVDRLLKSTPHMPEAAAAAVRNPRARR